MSSSDRTSDPLGLNFRGYLAPDQEAAHLGYTELRAENERLRRIAEAAASACRERKITPHLIDVLDAAGYETRPREPDPDEWLPPVRHP